MPELMLIFDETLLNALFRFVCPILLAALGGAICEKAGVFNIALEGLILVGAFAAVAGSYATGSALLGIVTALLSGVLSAGLLAILLVQFRANAIVVGIALNLFLAGLTAYLLRSFFGVQGALTHPQIQGIGIVQIPFLHDIPILGSLLSGHSGLVYLSWIAVICSHQFLYRHRFGLRLRGTGENPEAAIAMGVSVSKIQYGALLSSGVLCALAGAQLSLGNVTLFVEGMSAGRGWIAVVAVMLGQAHPIGVFISSTVFGLVDALSFRIQGFGWPSQFTEMLPYVVTLISLVLFRLTKGKRN